MTEDAIIQVVADHYRDPEAPVLLMSGLGKRLKDKEVWPRPHENRTLLEVIDATADLVAVRDDEAPSYIAITLKGDEQRATTAIAERHKRRFLFGLARAVLLAFTVDVSADETISIRLQPKPSYTIGPVTDADAIVVDPDLRLAGLDVTDLSETSSADIERLDANIRAWCERRGVKPSALARRRQVALPAHAKAAQPNPTSALERLYAAQPADIAGRLAIPMDIALVLSRMP